MRNIQLILRIVLAVSVGYLGTIIATELSDVEVTAPGLTMAATLFIMIAILSKAVRRFITSERLTEQAILDAAASPARLRARPLAIRLHRDRDKRARHEAAHAVVAHALGHRVISTSITAQHGSGGRVAWQHNGSLMASEDHVAVAFAGPLAEQTGDVILDTDDGADDYSALLRMAIAASITDPETRTPTEIIDAGTKAARQLVTEHAGAINTLTDELLATKEERDLEEAEIRDLMQKHHL